MPAPTKQKKSPAVSSQRGRDRRAEILKAAREVFLERGYSEASTDAILARSGGSKETIYAHFGNKLGLFRAVVGEMLDTVIAAITRVDDADPLEVLRTSGRTFVRTLLQPETIRLTRILIAESERIPELSGQFFERGHRDISRFFSDVIARCQAEGHFPGNRPDRLAEIYADMLTTGGLHDRALFDSTFRPSLRVIDATAADAFASLRQFGAASAGGARS